MNYIIDHDGTYTLANATSIAYIENMQTQSQAEFSCRSDDGELLRFTGVLSQGQVISFPDYTTSHISCTVVGLTSRILVVTRDGGRSCIESAVQSQPPREMRARKRVGDE